MQYKELPTPENQNRYIEIKSTVNNRVREIKELAEFGNEMEADMYGVQKRI